LLSTKRRMSMKLCTITIHFGVNHGSALQTYALSKHLTKEGHDVSVIDYIPERYKLWNTIKDKRAPLVIKIAYYLIIYPSRMTKRRIFERFLIENVKLTKRYNKEELLHNPPEADAYIAGSDQIWNKDYNGHGEYSYFLNFAKNGKNRIAYAASFGRNEIDNEEVADISKFISNIKYISVREDSGLNILKQCGIDRGITVLDPTLLLNSEEWMEIASKRNISEKYLLIYVMDHKFEKLIDYGEEIADRLNLKIFVISFKKIKDKRIDRNFININPREFLNLFNKASFVVSNSYHGILFSINFKKNFIAVAKHNYNTRIESILKLLKLEDRFVYNDFNILNALNPINYVESNVHLDKARKKSIDFLRSALSDVD
jgi:polysaccharide pyruvyl transferase WcaK-like protein